MKVLSGILIIILLTGFTSCNKIKLPAPELEAVYGRWQLYATSGGFSGGGIPEMDESKVRIIISANGEYEEYYDGEMTEERNFEIVDGADIGASEGEYYIDFFDLIDNFAYLRIQFNGVDTLTLSDSWMDGYSYHYVRIK